MSGKTIIRISFLVYILFFIVGCNTDKPTEKPNIEWKEYRDNYPRGISLYAGIDQKLPLKVWVVKIAGDAPNITTKVLVAQDTDNRETVADFAKKSGAFLAVNGGYFLMHKNPAHHVGLLKVDGKLVEPASESIIRTGLRYPVARGAFGIDENNKYDIAWASTKNDSLFEWTEPLDNSRGNPDSSLNFMTAQFWDMISAVHAGPVLVRDGKIHLYIDEEVFFDTSIPEIHPRTAVGYTKENDLILAVVDGRQTESRGVTLEELAGIMLQFDCVEALNLDGGGSSTLIIENKLINRPSGGTTQREVMSAIAVYVNE